MHLINLSATLIEKKEAGIGHCVPSSIQVK